MKTIHEQIQELGERTVGAHEANFFPREISRAQAVLTGLLELYEQLRTAQEEGIFEVTIRSRKSTVTLPVTEEAANQLSEDLWSMVGNQCDKPANVIAYSHEMLLKEGESPRRIKMLELLLTPISNDGMALNAPAGEPGPFLPETKGKSRRTAASTIPEERQRIA